MIATTFPDHQRAAEALDRFCAAHGPINGTVRTRALTWLTTQYRIRRIVTEKDEEQLIFRAIWADTRMRMRRFER